MVTALAYTFWELNKVESVQKWKPPNKSNHGTLPSGARFSHHLHWLRVLVGLLKEQSAKAVHEDCQDAGGLQLVARVELDATNRRDGSERRAYFKAKTEW